MYDIYMYIILNVCIIKHAEIYIYLFIYLCFIIQTFRIINTTALVFLPP